MFINAICRSVLLFGLVGPFVGTVLFIIMISIHSHDVSMILIIFFIPIYFFSYSIGGIPALITGIFYEVLYQKLKNKYFIYLLSSLIGGLAQFSYMMLYLFVEKAHLSITKDRIEILVVATLSALCCTLLATRIRKNI